jgi:putative transcriptional regulator
MDRKSLVRRNARMLDKLGFSQISVADTRSCFDILAEKNGSVLLLKVVKNVDSLNRTSTDALKKLGEFLDAETFIIGYMNKGVKLPEDSSLDRHGVACISGSALEYTLVSGDRPVQREKFMGARYKIDGQALKRLRSLYGVSMRELAEMLGISKDSIYRYEKDEAYATSDYVEKLERFFKNRITYGELSGTRAKGKQRYAYKKLNDKLEMEFIELGGAPFELLGKRSNRYEVGECMDPRTIEKLSVVYKQLAELLKNDYPFFIAEKAKRSKVNGIPVLTKKELLAVADEKELVSLIDSK